jgi:hypothetical protein
MVESRRPERLTSTSDLTLFDAAAARAKAML